MGVDAITVLGLLGESNRLTDDERARIVATAVQAAKGLPVIVGTSHTGTEATVALSRQAADLEPWLQPMRRLTWLRTTLFMARWRVQTREARDPSDPTQWSDAGLEPAMKAHIDQRIDQCFRRDTIQSIRAEWMA